MTARSGFAVLLAAVASATGCGPSPAPWAFDAFPEQKFRLEMHDETAVDEVTVEVERLADVRVASLGGDGSETELELFLDRYYLRVTGGPGKETQVAISPAAFVSRAADGTELRLDGDDRTPSALSVAALLERPLSGTSVDANGALARSSWHAADPLLQDVEVLGWLMLGLPILSGDDEAWTASREVPKIGSYRLGVELPLRFESVGGAPMEGATRHLRVTGFTSRPEILLTDGYAGSIELSLEGQVRLGPAGDLQKSELVLGMLFESKSGDVIRSRHSVVITCLECAGRGQISR
ncbi:MAG: hypothetical protein JRG76_13745 [Deltaproteobacteria bacterium]|nr:hypothetical protein [Deltaproteobacteria bacterium]MBW2415563.1 hypothetical protein [Deltaproteobacteria bacterium]